MHFIKKNSNRLYTRKAIDKARSNTKMKMYFALLYFYYAMCVFLAPIPRRWVIVRTADFCMFQTKIDLRTYQFSTNNINFLRQTGLYRKLINIISFAILLALAFE